ncbi:MAG: hypothetical protein II859_02310 [Bacteroidales bacterium]|nr:hypothetical protein [Bacteroidales bacterium]
MYNREYTPERITELKANEIFVFGSNLAGFKVGEIAPLFQDAIDIENIILPQAFVEILSPTKPIQNSYMVMDRVYAGEYPRDIDDR